MDFAPPFQDSEDGFTFKASQESSASIDNNSSIDGREALKIYQNEYLEALNNLNDDSIINLETETESADRYFEQTEQTFRCCKSCFTFGCEDSPPTTSKGIDFFTAKHVEQHAKSSKRNADVLSENEEDIEKVTAHDPNGINEIYYMNLEEIIGSRLNKKRLRLDSSLIDGFSYTNTPFNSPILESNRLTLAETELGNIESWNKIFSNSHKKEHLEDITISSFTQDIEDKDSWFMDWIETNAVIQDIEDQELDELKSVDLNLFALASHNGSGNQSSLPIYSIFFQETKLDTILDTGAATNYISRRVADKLKLKFPKLFAVKEIEE